LMKMASVNSVFKSTASDIEAVKKKVNQA
jgi:hypothetical protein